MAITNVTAASSFGGAPGQPTFVDIVQLDLDNNYPTGGYALSALLKAQIGSGRTILQMKQCNIVGTAVWCEYIRATGKLKCYDWAGSEIGGGTNLSTCVDLEFIVFSK